MRQRVGASKHLTLAVDRASPPSGEGLDGSTPCQKPLIYLLFETLSTGYPQVSTDIHRLITMRESVDFSGFHVLLSVKAFTFKACGPVDNLYSLQKANSASLNRFSDAESVLKKLCDHSSKCPFKNNPSTFYPQNDLIASQFSTVYCFNSSVIIHLSVYKKTNHPHFIHRTT